MELRALPPVSPLIAATNIAQQADSGMGGAAPIDAGKKGKKSLDAELNLVPFIDLLSCLISFLLITAVWTQVSAARVHPTSNVTDARVEEPPNTIPLRIVLLEGGFRVVAGSNVISEIPKAAHSTANGASAASYDSNRLVQELKKVKEQYPGQRAVTVEAEDAVTYEDLIHTVDALEAVAGVAFLPDVTVGQAT